MKQKTKTPRNTITEEAMQCGRYKKGAPKGRARTQAITEKTNYNKFCFLNEWYLLNQGYPSKLSATRVASG